MTDEKIDVEFAAPPHSHRWIIDYLPEQGMVEVSIRREDKILEPVYGLARTCPWKKFEANPQGELDLMCGMLLTDFNEHQRRRRALYPVRSAAAKASGPVAAPPRR